MYSISHPIIQCIESKFKDYINSITAMCNYKLHQTTERCELKYTKLCEIILQYSFLCRCYQTEMTNIHTCTSHSAQSCIKMFISKTCESFNVHSVPGTLISLDIKICTYPYHQLHKVLLFC